MIRLFAHPVMVRLLEILTLLGAHGPADGHGHFGAF